MEFWWFEVEVKKSVYIEIRAAGADVRQVIKYGT
jgi:hypothetical protein